MKATAARDSSLERWETPRGGILPRDGTKGGAQTIPGRVKAIDCSLASSRGKKGVEGKRGLRGPRQRVDKNTLKGRKQTRVSEGAFYGLSHVL